MDPTRKAGPDFVLFLSKSKKPRKWRGAGVSIRKHRRFVTEPIELFRKPQGPSANAGHLSLSLPVIPAKAGIQGSKQLLKHGFTDWTPAFAGETNLK